MRKQSRKTIRYHVFRQENRIKDSGATFLFRKIVPETLEEISKNEKSQKRLWRDFFVKKNLSGDYLMNLQSQKVITDIFWRCFLAEKLAQTLFDDRSSRKNGLKDFLRFFQREKADYSRLILSQNDKTNLSSFESRNFSTFLWTKTLYT
ncbi:MAG: hypothetical protein NT166_15700 [Candidatus Aminicenantes bacterium]|nr:hypothetical protein [Candidatus Aminicenantes bacterium]